MVRGGRGGEFEDRALDEGLALIGFQEVPDLSDYHSREAIRKLIRNTLPDATNQYVANWMGQLWAFKGRMQRADLVVLPSRAKPTIAIGRVAGDYLYRYDLPEGARHARPVEWLRTDIARTAIKEDLLHSLRARLTICELTRNNAYKRFEALATDGRDPDFQNAEMKEDSDTEATNFDLERAAKDQIIERISERFSGHGLSRLVAAIFETKGMTTFTSPVGKDGGIDVLAGSGPLGMDSPRICVQVKFTQSPADVRVVREIQAVAGNIGADQVLVVSWNGLTRDAEQELRNKFFNVRVWISDDLLRELTSVYDKLPEEIQAELPLKRIWTLATDKE